MTPPAQLPSLPSLRHICWPCIVANSNHAQLPALFKLLCCYFLTLSQESGEELFEVLACYFPVTFTPPPNDPNK